MHERMISPFVHSLNQPYQRRVPSWQSPLALSSLINQLGEQTRIDGQSGLVLLNNGLLDTLAKYPTVVAPPLSRLLQTSTNRLQVVEGLSLAQRLAKQNQQHPNPVLNTQLNSLFMATKRFGQTTDPVIQVYLAGFYRYLSGKAAYGPMVELLWQNAQTPATLRQQWPFNPNEEIGGTVLEHVANRVTRQVISQLAPLTPMPIEPEV